MTCLRRAVTNVTTDMPAYPFQEVDTCLGCLEGAQSMLPLTRLVSDAAIGGSPPLIADIRSMFEAVWSLTI
jgi:hypothetical protein